MTNGGDEPTMYFLDERHKDGYTALKKRFPEGQTSGEYAAALYIIAIPDIYAHTGGKLGSYPFEWFFEYSHENDDLVYTELAQQLSGGYQRLVEAAYSLYGSHKVNLAKLIVNIGEDLYKCLIQAMEIRLQRPTGIQIVE